MTGGPSEASEGHLRAIWGPVWGVVWRSILGSILRSILVISRPYSEKPHGNLIIYLLRAVGRALRLNID